MYLGILPRDTTREGINTRNGLEKQTKKKRYRFRDCAVRSIPARDTRRSLPFRDMRTTATNLGSCHGHPRLRPYVHPPIAGPTMSPACQQVSAWRKPRPISFARCLPLLPSPSRPPMRASASASRSSRLTRGSSSFAARAAEPGREAPNKPLQSMPVSSPVVPRARRSCVRRIRRCPRQAKLGDQQTRCGPRGKGSVPLGWEVSCEGPFGLRRAG